jgi:hypothetical protein
VDLVSDIPPEVDCGTDLGLRVRVSCDSGCDLRRGRVRVVGPSGEIASAELAFWDDAGNTTEDLVLPAPREVSDHCFRLAFESSGGSDHEESSRFLRFRTKAHATSMAVWGAPAPVAVRSAFTVKVGVRCSGCDLAGGIVRVRDEVGNLLSEGRLGRMPWPGTRGLHVAELSLLAPATEALFRWSGSFSGEGMELAHESSECRFSFRTAGPPEHTVRVEVTERDSGDPLEGVSVFLGTYHAATDSGGLAELHVPKGTYALVARKRDREAPKRNVAVEKDQTLGIQMGVLVRADPDEEEVWM